MSAQTLWIAALALATALPAAAPREEPMERIIGLYVHQHWPYNHPYAARTWTLEDWRGWADGCRRLGYNTFLIWPMLETIPDPPTASDRAYLARMTRVVEMLHRDFGMRVYLALCPNIEADDRVAARSAFEKRHYYYCDVLVNPGDPKTLERLMRRREKLLRPLAAVDGIAIIDSDPGCYPGSTNAEFVGLLAAHRRMMDRLRPGIELVYWMHAGWRGWSRFYETGKLLLGTPEEQLDTLTRLKSADPEPWGLANGLAYAEQLGVADRVISFNYGRIEGEPSFPMTNFGGTGASEGGAAPGPRGVMGNAQTHCVQLPNIFAFARGAAGSSPTETDYRRFADSLVPGLGAEILAGWQALSGTDAPAMRARAATLEAAAARKPTGGSLKGLLFGDPARFLTDLGLMLRQRAALEEFASAAETGTDVPGAFHRFVAAARAWQRRHGYQGNWWDGKMHTALRKLKSPAIDAVLDTTYEAREPFDPGIATAAEQVHANFRKFETFTTQLLRAMRRADEEIAGPARRAGEAD